MPERSFNEIYTAYYRRSFRFAKSYVHDDLVAEDIASESLIKLWGELKVNPMDEKRMMPLLLTILKNKALDHLRHEEVKRRALAEMADWQQHELSLRVTALEACNPDEIFSDEVETIVRQTLLSLSEQTRQAFVMSRFGGKTNQEIADELQITVKGVEYHITKSLKALRVALKDYLPLFYFFYYYQ